jgi:flagellar basal-body rod modification protein FlgD
MASIGTTLPSTTAASTTGTGTTGTSASTSSSNSLASQQTFLQLLVAQLQNQDPTQPVQGTEFVTQLATFSDVEQNLAVRQDVDAMSNKYLGSVPSGGTVVSTPTAGTAAVGTTAAGTVSGS